MADGYWENVVLLRGEFDFGAIRDDWEDREFEEDLYKGYELWEGNGDYFVLLEEQGAVLYADDEDDAKDVIKTIDRGSGSLAEAEDSDSRLIVDQLSGAPAIVAVASEGCDDEVSGCEGVGIAYSGVDLDLEEIYLDLTVLFSNERRATRAFEDYDEIVEAMEEWLDDIVSTSSRFDGIFEVDDIDIDELAQDVVFVSAKGIIEVEEE